MRNVDAAGWISRSCTSEPVLKALYNTSSDREVSHSNSSKPDAGEPIARMSLFQPLVDAESQSEGELPPVVQARGATEQSKVKVKRQRTRLRADTAKIAQQSKQIPLRREYARAKLDLVHIEMMKRFHSSDSAMAPVANHRGPQEIQSPVREGDLHTIMARQKQPQETQKPVREGDLHTIMVGKKKTKKMSVSRAPKGPRSEPSLEDTCYPKFAGPGG